MIKKSITRRRFIRDSSKAALAGALYFSLPLSAIRSEEKKSRVVLIRYKDIFEAQNKISQQRMQQMIDEAVMALVDETDPLKAWRKIISKDDVVGIKSNVWWGLYTPKELEQALRKRIMDCGVAAGDISIEDRRVLNDKVFNRATALINVRPLRTHDWSGVGSLIKNYIMFVKKPWEYHNDSCADLAALWKLPHVAGKTRLNILVMLTPQFHHTGAHHYNPEYTWPYCGLLVGFDPVAVDSTGVRILRAKRLEHFKEERPINPPPKHVFLADTRHHLGTADPAKIDLIRIGWQEEALI